MIPRLGRPPRPNLAYRLRPGAYAVLLSGDRVLMTEQALDTHVEVQLPGGGVDPGEAPIPALHREVWEETGHRCRIIRRLGAYRRFTYMSEYGFHAEKLCTIYLGQVGPRWGTPAEAGHRARFMSRDQALAQVHNTSDRWYMAQAFSIGAGP